MSFIRSKEIPPDSGNWYDYEVTASRVDGKVKQRVIRYIGKSASPHAPKPKLPNVASKYEGAEP